MAFIQFADFLPLAFNQIVSELGSMFWPTNGGWQCPVIVMATCGGYKPGLGPFHAQSFEAIAIAGATGSRTITNQELLDRFAHFKLPSTSEEIISKTGIESRPWVDPAKGETFFTLAVAAAQELLDRQCLTIHDVQLVIASTTTPDQITPSLACRVAAALAEDVYSCPSARSSVPTKSGKSAQSPTLPAYDINAACSGYLFSLAQAFDFLQHQPTACALVITSEVLSPLLDFTDEKTAPLFGDAATATLLVGPEWHDAPHRES